MLLRCLGVEGSLPRISISRQQMSENIKINSHAVFPGKLHLPGPSSRLSISPRFPLTPPAVPPHRAPSASAPSPRPDHVRQQHNRSLRRGQRDTHSTLLHVVLLGSHRDDCLSGVRPIVGGSGRQDPPAFAHHHRGPRRFVRGPLFHPPHHIHSSVLLLLPSAPKDNW